MYKSPDADKTKGRQGPDSNRGHLPLPEVAAELHRIHASLQDAITKRDLVLQNRMQYMMELKRGHHQVSRGYDPSDCIAACRRLRAEFWQLESSCRYSLATPAPYLDFDVVALPGLDPHEIDESQLLAELERGVTWEYRIQRRLQSFDRRLSEKLANVSREQRSSINHGDTESLAENPLAPARTGLRKGNGNQADYLTPPEVAQRMQVKPETVRGWICSGELTAIDVARNGCKRPRFRVSMEAFQQFEKSRSATPAKKAPRRKRPAGKDYFPDL